MPNELGNLGAISREMDKEHPRLAEPFLNGSYHQQRPILNSSLAILGFGKNFFVQHQVNPTNASSEFVLLT